MSWHDPGSDFYISNSDWNGKRGARRTTTLVPFLATATATATTSKTTSRKKEFDFPQLEFLLGLLLPVN